MYLLLMVVGIHTIKSLSKTLNPELLCMCQTGNNPLSNEYNVFFAFEKEKYTKLID